MAWAWSYSRWSCWSTCPLQYKFKHVDKLPETKSQAMLDGIRVHEALANVILKGDAPPPEVHKKTVALLEEIKQQPRVIAEQQWAFDKGWSVRKWFGKDVWVRAILDVGILYSDGTAEAIDWKYGKLAGDYDDQMELFALSVFKYMPSVSHVTTRLHSAKTGAERFADYDAVDVPSTTDKWERRAIAMQEDTEFKPRPNDKCRWCTWRKSNGGPCIYG